MLTVYQEHCNKAISEYEMTNFCTSYMDGLVQGGHQADLAAFQAWMLTTATKRAWGNLGQVQASTPQRMRYVAIEVGHIEVVMASSPRESLLPTTASSKSSSIVAHPPTWTAPSLSFAS